MEGNDNNNKEEKKQYIRGNIVTEKEVLFGGWVEVTGDTFTRVERADVSFPKHVDPNKHVVDADFIVPSFIDIHNHGFAKEQGAELLDNWLHPEFCLNELARCGTLSTLASLIITQEEEEEEEGENEEKGNQVSGGKTRQNSCNNISTSSATAVMTTMMSSKKNKTKKKSVDQSRTRALVKSVRSRYQKYTDNNCCVIEGIHLESPVIRDIGGLPQSMEKNISLNNFKLLVDAMLPELKVVTISPSLEKRFDPPFGRTKYLIEKGVRPALGHDRNCEESDIVPMLSCHSSSSSSSSSPAKTTAKTTAKETNNTNGGKNDYKFHTTHYCNVMSFNHRNVSLVNFTLCRNFPKTERYAKAIPPTTEFIGDLTHVHPIAIQNLLSARSPLDVCVISDCISNYQPGKRLKYNGRTIIVSPAGGCYLCDSLGRPTHTLAGSTVTIADQFSTLVSVFSLDLVTACLICSTSAARIAHIDDRVGSIAVGKKANLLLLNGACTKILKRMIYGSFTNHEPYQFLRPPRSHL